jgi:hypothetical protein
MADPTAHRSLAGALQNLTFTRLDLTYVVQQIYLHMHDPRKSHCFAEAPSSLRPRHCRLRLGPPPVSVC